jgi:hypothetical protein
MAKRLGNVFYQDLDPESIKMLKKLVVDCHDISESKNNILEV